MITTFTAELPLGLAQAVAEQPHKMYLYLEYTNTSGEIPTSYTTAVSIPNFSNPKVYYSGLANKNFLRVPAIRDPNVTSSTAGNPVTYTVTATFFGQSGGAAGELSGTAFGNNSICYGAALVLAAPGADRTADVILARTYFTGVSERLTKTASSELFVTFPFSVSVTTPV